MADYYRDEYRRARDAPVRIKETVYMRAEDLPSIPRATASTDLVRRARDDDDTPLEEIPRDFLPEQAYDYDRRSTRSLERSRGYDYDGLAYAARYGDDPRRSADQVGLPRRERPRERGRSLSRTQELAAAAAGAGLAIGGKEIWDRREGGKHKPRSKSRLGQVALGLAGAAAGDLVAKRIAKEHERHHRREDEAHGGGAAGYGRYQDDDGYPARPRPNRRKSIVEMGEAALGALGLGAVVGRHHSRSRSRSRDRDYDRRRRRHRRRGSSSSISSDSLRSRSRRRGGSVDRNKRLQQAAQAALAAAAAEAWRTRKEPGGYFEGDKARRILTAAVGAGGIDALVDKDPDHHESRHVGEGAIGGLLLNRVLNGSRGDVSGRRRGASRSRSRSRGGTLKDIGAAGVAAGVAKKLMDRSRSRSRSQSGRHRRRRYSSSSSSDRGPRRHRRSKSVSDYIDKGMSKLGIKDGHDRDDRRSSRRSDVSARDVGGARAATGAGVAAGLGAAAASHRRRRGSRRGGRDDSSGSDDGSGSGSDLDSDFSLSEEERNRRKLKGKELLTAGLATVATVHAAHEIYESMDKRKKRLKAVSEGKLSPEEAKKQRTLAQMKDAATLGLVGLGVKGVVGSWQETNAKRKEIREFEAKLERHRRIAAQRGQRSSRRGGENGQGSRRDRERDGNRDRDRDRRSSVSGPVYHDGNPYGAS